MLDDFGHELEMTDSKLQQTVLKVEKVLRLSDGKSEVFLDCGNWVKCYRTASATDCTIVLLNNRSKLRTLHLSLKRQGEGNRFIFMLS